MRRMIVNGQRALVAFDVDEFPHVGDHNSEQRAVADMYWLQTGEEQTPFELCEPVGAVN